MRNAKPSYVLAKKTGDLPWMKTDDVRVLVDAEKASGLVVCCTNSPYHGDNLNILGTKMGLAVDLWGRSILKFKPKTQNPLSVGKANVSLAGQGLSILGTTFSNFLTMGIGGVKVSAHYGFIKSFVDSLEKGGSLPVSEEKAKENVAMVESICRQIDESVGEV